MVFHLYQTNFASYEELTAVPIRTYLSYSYISPTLQHMVFEIFVSLSCVYVLLNLCLYYCSLWHCSYRAQGTSQAVEESQAVSVFCSVVVPIITQVCGVIM